VAQKESFIFCLHSKKHVAAMVADASATLRRDANANAATQHNRTAPLILWQWHYSKMRWPWRRMLTQEIELAVSAPNLDAANCIGCDIER